MYNTNEIDGTYGGSQTPCTVLVYGEWYCVAGSRNVNATREDLDDGVDIEQLDDYDTSSASHDIDTLESLVNHVDETRIYDGIDLDTLEGYDTDNIETDYFNGNFTANQLEDYSYENIVLASFDNGQKEQARIQAESYGLDYDVVIARNRAV